MKLYRIAPEPSLGHQDRTFSDYRTCIFLELIAVQVLPDYHGMAHALQTSPIPTQLSQLRYRVSKSALGLGESFCKLFDMFCKGGHNLTKHVFDMFLSPLPFFPMSF